MIPSDYLARHERVLVITILAGHLLLTFGFSLGPIFEGPDEIEHYRYVRTLAEERALPNPYAQQRGEYHQPPLYYLLLVPVALLVEDGDFGQIDGRLNPFYGADIHIPGNDNKNLYLHSRAEAFPYDQSGTARAVHLMRLVSIPLSVGTLLAGWAALHALWPGHPARRLLALGVMAFWPQNLFLSGVINNDVLLIFFSTVVFWLLVRHVRRGWTQRSALVLGVAIGAAMLTKVSALFLGFPIALAFALDRRAWRLIPLTLGAASLVAGWWYVRNAVQYSDPTLTDAVLHTWRSEVIRPGKLALDIGWERLPFAYETAWARFGQGAVAVASPVGTFFDLVVGLGLGGLVATIALSIARNKRRLPDWAAMRLWIVTVVFAASWVGALLYWASTAWSGNQGRYVLPGIVGWAALITLGTLGWMPRRIAAGAALLGTAACALVATWALWGSYLPAYSPSAVPNRVARPLSYEFEGVARLIGMAPAAPAARPGETIRLSLYWQALRPAETELLAYVHSVETMIVRRDSVPATGNLLATEWRSGEIWAEHYIVTIPQNTGAPLTDLLIAGLYDPQAGRPLQARNESGHPVTPVINTLTILSSD